MVRLFSVVCAPFVTLGQECSGWSQIAEDEVAMLQGRVDLLARDVSASEQHKPRQSQPTATAHTNFMLQTVRRLAKDMSGDVMSILADLRNEVAQIMTLLDAEHLTDSQFVQMQFAEIQACLDAHDVDGLAQAVQNACDSCSECKTELADAINDRETACQDWNTFAQQMWNQMVTACQHPSSFGQSKNGVGCHANECSAQGSQDLVDIAVQMSFWESHYEEMVQKRSACEQACLPTTCVDCESHSNNFEQGYCEMQVQCSMLEACHDHEKDLYDQAINMVHVSQIDGLNTIQQESYLMHQQILCIVDLIDAAYPHNQTVSDTSLDECSADALRQNSVIESKLMELDIPRETPPSPTHCEVPSCSGSCLDSAAPECPEVEATTIGFTNGAPTTIDPGVYKLSMASTNLAGDYLTASRSMDRDRRDDFSSYAMVQSSSPGLRHNWIIEAGSAGTFRLSMASGYGHNQGNQPAGWYLTAARENGEGDGEGVRDDHSSYAFVSAGEPGLQHDWIIERGSESGTFRFSKAFATGNQPAGWYLTASRAQGSDRNFESSYALVHDSDGDPGPQYDWFVESVN